jgi:hypothetical protein
MARDRPGLVATSQSTSAVCGSSLWTDASLGDRTKRAVFQTMSALPQRRMISAPIGLSASTISSTRQRRIRASIRVTARTNALAAGDVSRASPPWSRGTEASSARNSSTASRTAPRLARDPDSCPRSRIAGAAHQWSWPGVQARQVPTARRGDTKQSRRESRILTEPWQEHSRRGNRPIA